MSDLAERTVTELSALLGSGGASCREAVQASLDRIDSVDQRIGAFLSVRHEDALREADAADRARRAGETRSPLHGVPIAVKANMVSPEFETSCASRILRGFRAPYEATVLRRLREAGLVVVGTTNMDEFAMGSSTENSCRSPTRNPWDPERVPGGSSGGATAAVAAREVPASLGSDTGGSIRQPASLCGVVGLKPTYGRVSRNGLVAFASSLDQIGPIARTVADVATLLRVISGHDPRDSTSLPSPVPDYSESLSGSIAGLRVGLPRECFSNQSVDAEVLASVREAVGVLESLGAEVVELSLPHSEYGVAAYYLICTAEASSNLSRYDGVRYGLREDAPTLEGMYRKTRSRGFGAEVKRRILLGTFVLSAGYYEAYYRKAQQVRTLIRRDFDRAFERCDVIAMPTTPGPAWPIGERVDDPVRMYVSDVFTVTVNLAGLPGLSLPSRPTASRLPIGLQLVGQVLDEGTVLRVADAYQRETDYHLAAPEL